MPARGIRPVHLFIVAAFLALIASGPTFSGRHDQLAAAASGGCTQTDSNGAIVNNDCQHVDRTVSETSGSSANPTVTNQGECTNDNIQRWSASPDPSLQQKASDCKAKIGTITYKKPDGTTGTICATCSGGGMVSEGSGGQSAIPGVEGVAPADTGPLPSTNLDSGTQALFDATFGQEAQGTTGSTGGTSGADFGGLLGGDAGSPSGSQGGYLGLGQGLNGNLSEESALSPGSSQPSYTNNSAFNTMTPAFTSSGVSGFGDVAGTALGDSSPGATWDYSSPLGGDSAMNGPGAISAADAFAQQSPAFARYAATGSAFPISVVDPAGNTIATLHGEDYGLTGTGEITVDAAHLNGNPIGMGSQADRIANTLLTSPEQSIFSNTNGDGHTLAQDIGTVIDSNESQKAWYTQAWESLNGGSDRLSIQGDVTQDGVTNYLYSPDQLIIGQSADEYAAQQASRAWAGLPGAATGVTPGSDAANLIAGDAGTQSGGLSQTLNQQNPLIAELAQRGFPGTQSGVAQTEPQAPAFEVSNMTEAQFKALYPDASLPAFSNPNAPFADKSIPGTTEVADYTNPPGSTAYSLPPASQPVMNQQNPMIAALQQQGAEGSQSGHVDSNTPAPIAQTQNPAPVKVANNSQPVAQPAPQSQPTPRQNFNPQPQPSRSSGGSGPSASPRSGSGGGSSPAVNPFALAQAIPVSQLLRGSNAHTPSMAPQPTLNVLATNQPSAFTVPLYTQPVLQPSETEQSPQGAENSSVSPTPSSSPSPTPTQNPSTQNPEPSSASGNTQAPAPAAGKPETAATPAPNASPVSSGQSSGTGAASASPRSGAGAGAGDTSAQGESTGAPASGSNSQPSESKVASAEPAHPDQHATSTPSGSANKGSAPQPEAQPAPQPEPAEQPENPITAEVTPAKTNIDKTVDTIKAVASLPLKILTAVLGSTPAEAREAFLDRNPSDTECLSSPQCLIARTGLSTWYDPALGGINGTGTTANGERYQPNAKTFASVSLPLNTVAQVCSGGKCEFARVNDTGSFGRAPYSRPGAPRISDLTRMFAQEMGISGANPVRITPVAIVANKGIAGAQTAQTIVQSLNGGAPLADATKDFAPQLRWVSNGLPASAGATVVSAPSFKTFSSALDPNAKPASQQKPSEPAKKPARDYLAPLKQPMAQLVGAKELGDRAGQQSDPQLALQAANQAKAAVDKIVQVARAEAADQQTAPADAQALNDAAAAAQAAANDAQARLTDFNRLPKISFGRSQYSEQGRLRSALASDGAKVASAVGKIGTVSQKTGGTGEAADIPFTQDGITGARVQAAGAQGALQKFADAQKYAFGRTGSDGKTEMLSPQDAAKLSPEERNKLDVYRHASDGTYQKAGPVPQYLAQQKAAAEAVLKNASYDAQLNANPQAKALAAGGTLQTAGAGTVRPVYALAGDGTKKQIGIVHAISDENARVLAAAQKQGVHVLEKNGQLFDDQGRKLELRAEGSKLAASVPKQQVPTTFHGKVAKAAGVALQKMSHEDWVAALQKSGVKVQDLSSRVPVASNLAWSTAGTRVMIHGDVASGDNLVKYEMNQLAAGKIAAQAVLKEDGTFVILKRLDTGAFQAGSSNRDGFGFETAGADGGKEATDAQFGVQKKIVDIALSHGIEVGTHGMAEPGHRMASEGGTRIVSYVYGNGPVMSPQVALYGIDAAGNAQKIGGTINSGDIAGASGSTTFESTDPNGKPDGKVKFALQETDTGTVTPELSVDENGNLGVDYRYTPPPAPQTPPIPTPPSPMQRAMNAFRNFFGNMFHPPQMPQFPHGGGSGSGGSGGPSVPHLPPPPTPRGQATFSCSPDSVETKATSTPITINWNCAGAKAQGFGFETGGTSAGSVTFSTTTAAQSLSFALLCSTDSAAPQNLTCTTRVLHPVAAVIANPDTIDAGGSAALMWASADTTGCKLYGPPHTLLTSGGPNGEARTSLTQPSVFQLACESASGLVIQASTTVRIAGDSSAPIETSVGDTITQ